MLVHGARIAESGVGVAELADVEAMENRTPFSQALCPANIFLPQARHAERLWQMWSYLLDFIVRHSSQPPSTVGFLELSVIESRWMIGDHVGASQVQMFKPLSTLGARPPASIPCKAHATVSGEVP